ncbi:LysR family transcriptional regulator [Aerophototrophica crusticola]|uniref:LysR family transcriptional regulator n=1 Tax=Aerophototrophica crusticola TaxID=1709002 RepID=A0A858R724_9PROT|nr:LysR family transcriptional regulator [Rhodospirillaceae bacterium B3]
MDSTDLAFFAAVAEEGGISAAARRLHCVQSNVTARIRALEAALGVPLFHRNGRGVVPTRAGEVLLPHARKVAAALADARSALRDLMDPATPRGPLAIGSMETTAAVRLPAVLMAFHRAHPDVELTLHTGPTGLLLGEVAGYRLDAALVAGPVEHPDMVAEPLGVEEMVVATAANAIPWPALLEQPSLAALSFRRGCAYRERLEAMLAALNARHVRLLEFGTLEGIIGGVAAGIGIALLPRAAAEGSRLAGALRLHPAPAPFATAPTVLVRRRDALVTAALARFTETARLGWEERRAAA